MSKALVAEVFRSCTVTSDVSGEALWSIYEEDQEQGLGRPPLNVERGKKDSTCGTKH